MSAYRTNGGSAIYSEDERHRLLLRRDLVSGEGAVTFIGLNPSTATAETNDPTIRRCIGFAERWGKKTLYMANLYAFRSTDPSGLWQVDDPVGNPSNDEYIKDMAKRSDLVIAAWGANAKRKRAKEVHHLLLSKGIRLLCLGTTKAGNPRHPLYLRADTEPEVWT